MGARRRESCGCRLQSASLVAAAALLTFPGSTAFLLPIKTTARQSQRGSMAPCWSTSLEEAPSQLKVPSQTRAFSVPLEFLPAAAPSSADLGMLGDLLIELGAQGVSQEYGTASRPPRMEVWWDAEDRDAWDGQLRAAIDMLHESGVPRLSVSWGEARPVPMEAEWRAAAEGEGFKPVEAGRFQVVPVQLCADEPEPPGQQIRILSGMGWGDGRHPTTRLCLEFLSMEGVICGGERVIDYGTGSGVLSIGAMQLGAMECVGVDICYDALSNADVNTKLNGVSESVDVMHGRTIVPGDFPPADVVIANILVGTLLSLSSVIISLTKPGGWLCLSGVRPEQVDVVKRRYAGQVEWDDSLEAKAEHPTWGWWVRIVGRRKMGGGQGGESWSRTMSEAAVS